MMPTPEFLEHLGLILIIAGLVLMLASCVRTGRRPDEPDEIAPGVPNRQVPVMLVSREDYVALNREVQELRLISRDYKALKIGHDAKAGVIRELNGEVAYLKEQHQEALNEWSRWSEAAERKGKEIEALRAEGKRLEGVAIEKDAEVERLKQLVQECRDDGVCAAMSGYEQHDMPCTRALVAEDEVKELRALLSECSTILQDASLQGAIALAWTHGYKYTGPTMPIERIIKALEPTLKVTHEVPVPENPSLEPFGC